MLDFKKREQECQKVIVFFYLVQYSFKLNAYVSESQDPIIFHKLFTLCLEKECIWQKQQN